MLQQNPHHFPVDEGPPAQEGNAEHKEGHAEHHVPPAAKAYSSTIVGSVIVVMCTFYLVNSSDPDIRMSTWQVLNMTVSIFSSVLIFGTLTEAVSSTLGLQTEEEHVYLDLFLFSMLYILLQVLLYFVMRHLGDENSMRASGTVMAHITGFAGMYSCAGLMSLPFAEDSITNTFGVLVGQAVVLSVLTAVSAKARTMAALADDGEISKKEEEWMEEVTEVEDDVISLSLGFAVMQAIRKAVTGHTHPFEAVEEPLKVSQHHTHALFICALILMFMTAAVAFVSHRIESGNSRLMSNLRNVSSASMAWCMLFWGEWQIYACGFEDVRIAGLLLLALLSSILSFALIFILDFLADRHHGYQRELRMIIFALGLLVGFSWERAFDVSFEQFAAHHGGSYYLIVRHFMPLIFSIMVLPAWAWYILPRAMQSQEEAEEAQRKTMLMMQRSDSCHNCGVSSPYHSTGSPQGTPCDHSAQAEC